MTTPQEFMPRWASSPGATIQDLMKRNGVALADIADACNMPVSEFESVLCGATPITKQTAEALAFKVGGSSAFWLRREARYRESEEIVEADKWVNSLPLKSMKQFAWLDVPNDWRTRIDACLEFFGSDSLEAWNRSYGKQLQGVRFRTSATYPNQVSSVATWLRAGEIASRDLPVGRFKPRLLEDSVHEFRKLTRVPDPANFLPEMQKIAAASGVSCIIVPAPDGCAASGASRILQNGSALIQLTGRYLSDDQFWFSVFHEIGHLVLHGGAALHIDGDASAFEASQEESEANTFAADVLWPFENRPHFRVKLSRRDVFRLAREAGTSPGILVGQLQSSGVLRYDEYNNLKRRYKRLGSGLALKI
ncbi:MULTISPECIES: ImmA/IrrE family metallo-endopeptidase [unclassified Arthrobacter]|uniref:ImmA/IrrE family metallo-endopeptidase n=1 Tax=unclassified Arthrobacter TaxID=235627 RepID=UPI001E4C2AE8|nr:MULTISPECIES: ImmA/IrrE family metallo-endopeptidase [unclassified Arthrobacter]MCC9146849.1 ImmA/IrrE family metallo-endopeptidase [Arthrobacter sp. zg-Y919]MDK1278080.1 ImmA/IrrE family metallo-endopeptidase [Arthrobacter sp. zg.Y919]WIB03332.1 ImmA/IrrE family metallo-endopeptidase [Arthrobacter sp. zg-Y919]